MEENHILWNYSAAAVDVIPPRIEVRSLARIEKQKAQKGIVIVEVGSSRQIEIVSQTHDDALEVYWHSLHLLKVLKDFSDKGEVFVM